MISVLSEGEVKDKSNQMMAEAIADMVIRLAKKS
jgi:hypothetical protein